MDQGPAAGRKEIASGADGAGLFAVQCSGCHNVEDGLSHRLGPDLFGVVGRPLRPRGAVSPGQRDEVQGVVMVGGATRMPGGQSRWSGEKDLSWTPVQPGVVIEVSYDQLEGDRFRHATRFHRWRPDKAAEDCTMAQLERPEGPGFSRVVDFR